MKFRSDPRPQRVAAISCKNAAATLTTKLPGERRTPWLPRL